MLYWKNPSEVLAASDYSILNVKEEQPARLYLAVVETSTVKGKPENILTTRAIARLAKKLRTTLQLQHYLTLAMAARYQPGENR